MTTNTLGSSVNDINSYISDTGQEKTRHHV